MHTLPNSTPLGPWARLPRTTQEALLNPYDDTMDRANANAIVRELRRARISIRLEQLYTKEGYGGCMRVGLFDESGCFEERLYTREGQQSLELKGRRYFDSNGKVPKNW